MIECLLVLVVAEMVWILVLASRIRRSVKISELCTLVRLLEHRCDSAVSAIPYRTDPETRQQFAMLSADLHHTFPEFFPDGRRRRRRRSRTAEQLPRATGNRRSPR